MFILGRHKIRLREPLTVPHTVTTHRRDTFGCPDAPPRENLDICMRERNKEKRRCAENLFKSQLYPHRYGETVDAPGSKTTYGALLRAERLHLPGPLEKKERAFEKPGQSVVTYDSIAFQ